MNCPICDGTLEPRDVNICACDELPPVVVRGVPALVCIRCGEKVLTQNSIDVLGVVRTERAPRPTPMSYQLYDFKALQGAITLNEVEVAIRYLTVGSGPIVSNPPTRIGISEPQLVNI